MLETLTGVESEYWKKLAATAAQTILLLLKFSIVKLVAILMTLWMVFFCLKTLIEWFPINYHTHQEVIHNHDSHVAFYLFCVCSFALKHSKDDHISYFILFQPTK